MTSPFPGMDPYLEQHWLDVHARLVSYSSDQLNAKLPEDLIARMEEQLVIDQPDAEVRHTIRPDVRVFQPGWSEPDEAGGLMIEAPYKLVVDLEPVRQRQIQIIRADDELLITVIEFLSPANKLGKGLAKYRQKRDELLEAGINIVEVDLCREGDWREIVAPHHWPSEAPAAYRALVRPGHAPQMAYAYPLPLDRPLPALPIPLRPGDPRVLLELQPLVSDAYRNGRYYRTIDYNKPPRPPLEPSDATIAEKLLKQAVKE